MTRAELATLARLTQAVAEAVTQGNLDRALELLMEREKALQGLAWPSEAEASFWEELEALKQLEWKILDFCQTWQEVVKARLQVLNQGQVLRAAYNPCEDKSRFININK